MHTLTKLWIKEIYWIMAILILSILIHVLAFKRLPSLTTTIDIQMHDTYFVISGLSFLLDIFILIASIVYVIKGATLRYNQVFSNLLLAVLLVALLFLLLGWHNKLLFFEAFRHGWTIYPPLSALPGSSEQDTDLSIGFWHIVFIMTECIILGGLFMLGFKTGKLQAHRCRNNAE